MKVLCVGYEPEILKLRALVLETAGLAVSIGDPAEALARAADAAFDTVVVSHEVSSKDFDRIRSGFNGTTRLLRLDRFTKPEELIATVKNGG